MRRKTPTYPTAADLVTLLLARPGVYEDAYWVYATLADDLSHALRHSGCRGGWEALDMPSFVLMRASGRRGRAELCRKLATLVSCMWSTGALPRRVAAELYDQLARLCPDDAPAQAFIAWAGRHARLTIDVEARERPTDVRPGTGPRTPGSSIASDR